MTNQLLCACAAALALAAPPTQQPDSQAIRALTNVTLIDGTGTAPQRGMTIIVERERIHRIFPTGEQRLPQDAEVHDLTGRFVVPGLIDTHVHLRQLSAQDRGARVFDREAVLAELERSVYGGVTVIREMVADVQPTAEVAALARAGAIPSPEIHYAVLMAGVTFLPPGAAADSGGTAGISEGVTPDTDIASRMAAAVSAGASGVKIYADLDSELVHRIAAEARRHKLQVWAHATVFPTRPIDVVRAGAQTLSHVCGLPWQVLPNVPQRFNSRPSFDPAEVDIDDIRFAELFGEMARRGVVLDATTYLYRNPATQARGCSPAVMIGLARKAHDAGVSISTGTDFVNVPDEPYPSLHLEIIHLVEAGVMTPGQAIVAATRSGARAIGIEATHGTIEEGKVADLVILAEDPLEDIAAIRTVVAVFKRGKLYERDNYRRR